jgi:hypothetical protein
MKYVLAGTLVSCKFEVLEFHGRNTQESLGVRVHCRSFYHKLFSKKMPSRRLSVMKRTKTLSKSNLRDQDT